MALQAAFIVPHPPLIVPAVGRGREEEIRTTIDAYDEVARQIAELAPQTIIVTSPHATAYQDYFHISPGTEAHGDMRRFDARDADLSCAYDTELAGRIAQLAADEGFPAGTDYERDPSIDHATYIPLYFVDKFYRDYEVVRVGLSGYGPIKHYHLGQLVAKAVDELGRRAVLVASGDLSHKLAPDGPYGFAPEGPAFDAQVTEAMAQGDFMRILGFDARLLSYEGPFGVGYAVASFIVTGDDDGRCFAKRYEEEERERVRAKRAGEDPYVALARASVEHFVRHHTPLERPDGLPEEMLTQRAGVFVSLHEHGRLRGCIGTIGPATRCIADEIIRNGISACSEDPRFEPVRESELDQLEISVDVLGEPQDIDSTDELDPQRYGVIVTNAGRRGLLLPMLDGVDTIEEQIAIAKRKAGIGDYEPGTILQRFEVVRHE